MAGYDIAAIRKRLLDSQKGRLDPDEFRPDKAKSATDPLVYRFFILGPVIQGQQTKQGPAKGTMEQFYLTHAAHWVHDRPHACPRQYLDSNESCAMCDFGFNILREVDKNDKIKRQALVKEWMPTASHAINIWFPPDRANPEELHNQVRFYNAPKTILDILIACLLRDDVGDARDPKAHGVFFDENAAFLFQLEAVKFGQNNSYKTSKFLTSNGIPTPIATTADGKPDRVAIERIMNSRHDLFAKIPKPSSAKIQQLLQELTDGSSGSGFDGDETKPAPSKPQQQASQPRQRTQAAPPVSQPSSTLDEEAPMQETPPAKSESPKATKQATKQAAKPAPTLPADDDPDDDIGKLLRQIDEDD